MSNIECRRNEFCLFYKKIEQRETTLRYSAVQYSTVLRFAFENPERLTLNLYFVKPLLPRSQHNGIIIVQILLGNQLVKSLYSVAIDIRASLLDESSGRTV